MKRAVEKVAGAIAGEHATGSIRAVRAGREAENDELRLRIAEAADGPSPILFVAIRATFRQRDRFAMRDEPRALWQSGLMTLDGLAKPALARFSALAKPLDARNQILTVKAGNCQIAVRDS